MTIQQDIDKLFNKGLADYSVNPPGFVWDNIESRLNHKRLKRRRNLIYSLAASVALLLSFGAGYMFNWFQSTNLIAENNTEIILEPQPQQLPVPEQIKAPIIENDESTVNKNRETPAIIEKTKLEPIENEIIESEKINTEKKPEPPTNKNAKVKTNIKKVNSSGTLLPPMFADNGNYENKQPANVMGAQNNEYGNEMIRMKHIDLTQPDVRRELNYDTRQLAYADAYDVVPNAKVNESPWSVGIAAAPLLSYRDVVQVSSNALMEADISSNYNQNYTNEKPLMSYSAGIDVNYKVAKRWKVQSGIYFSELGQISENVALNGALVIGSTDDLSYQINTSTGNIKIQGTQNEIIDRFSQNTVESKSDMLFSSPLGASYKRVEESFQTSFVQTYSFYEVPIVVNYTVIDRKLSMNITGGMSANILYGSNIYVENEGTRYELNADEEDLKDMNYSAVFGLGFDYPIINKLKFNLQPTFRYSINPINNSGSVYPYSFGFYSGLQYSF